MIALCESCDGQRFMDDQPRAWHRVWKLCCTVDTVIGNTAPRAIQRLSSAMSENTEQPDYERQSPTVSSPEFSSTERRRLRRALFRFELLRGVFMKVHGEYGASTDVGRLLQCAVFHKLPPCEREEVSVFGLIWLHLQDLFDKAEIFVTDRIYQAIKTSKSQPRQPSRTFEPGPLGDYMTGRLPMSILGLRMFEKWFAQPRLFA